jgi:hypothetical protein
MPIGRGVIPHDLVHLAAEAHFGIEDGFWGLLARGATFKNGTDRRPTRPGRALIAENRVGLNAAEHLGNAHHTLWMQGERTPVSPTFDRLAEQWLAVPDLGTLIVHWPMTGPNQPRQTTRFSSSASRAIGSWAGSLPSNCA